MSKFFRSLAMAAAAALSPYMAVDVVRRERTHHGNRTGYYAPHQGEREKARRRRQMAKARDRALGRIP